MSEKRDIAAKLRARIESHRELLERLHAGSPSWTRMPIYLELIALAWVEYLKIIVFEVSHVAKLLNRGKSLASDKSESEPKVPRLGELLISVVCQRKVREAVLGDLEEGFQTRAHARGARIARRWYWWQVAKSAAAFTWRWTRRLLELDELIRRIGF